MDYPNKGLIRNNSNINNMNDNDNINLNYEIPKKSIKSTEDIQESKEEGGEGEQEPYTNENYFQENVNNRDQNILHRSGGIKNITLSNNNEKEQQQLKQTNSKLFSNDYKQKLLLPKKKNLFSEEMNETLENYYSVVKKSENLKDKSSMFFDLYEKHIENKDFVFMLFWYPFINSDELLSVEILNTTPVYMGDRVIESIFTISMSSKELNNYAFQLGVENKFHESLLLIIIKQGKIKLPLEWLFEQIKLRAVNLLEDCWLAANDCFFETQNFSQQFLEFYKQNLNLNSYSEKANNSSLANFKSIKSFFKNKVLGASNRQTTDVNNNFSFDPNNYSGKNGNKAAANANRNEKAFAAAPSSGGFTPGIQKEFLELLNKNNGKLTISKLILLANLHLKSGSSITTPAEKEPYLNLIRAMCSCLKPICSMWKSAFFRLPCTSEICAFAYSFTKPILTSKSSIKKLCMMISSKKS